MANIDFSINFLFLESFYTLKTHSQRNYTAHSTFNLFLLQYKIKWRFSIFFFSFFITFSYQISYIFRKKTLWETKSNHLIRFPFSMHTKLQRKWEKEKGFFFGFTKQAETLADRISNSNWIQIQLCNFHSQPFLCVGLLYTFSLISGDFIKKFTLSSLYWVCEIFSIFLRLKT